MSLPDWLLQTLPTEPGYWLAGFAVAAVVFLVVRQSARKQKDPLDTPPSQQLRSEQRQAERDLSNLLVEMSQMARNVTSQIETRCAKLETLLKEADETIAALEALQSGRTDRPARPSARREEGSPVASGSESTDPRHRRIYDLQDLGKSAGQIAQEVGAPRGEVELILALRPRLGKSRTPI